MKTNKQKRVVFFLLSLLIPIGIPLLVVLIKYDVIKAFMNAPTKVQISLIAAIFIICLFVSMAKKINKFLNDMEFSTTKCIINGCIKIVPLICILLLFVNMYKFVNDIVFVMEWIVPCSAVSLFYFEPKYQYYTKLCKEDEQINIIKKAMK